MSFVPALRQGPHRIFRLDAAHDARSNVCRRRRRSVRPSSSPSSSESGLLGRPKGFLHGGDRARGDEERVKGLDKVVQRGEEVAEGGQGACEELWRSSCPAGALSSSTTTAKDSLRGSRLRTKTLRRDRYARSLPPRRCELTVPPHQLPPKIDLLSSLPVETLTAILR